MNLDATWVLSLSVILAAALAGCGQEPLGDLFGAGYSDAEDVVYEHHDLVDIAAASPLTGTLYGVASWPDSGLYRTDAPGAAWRRLTVPIADVTLWSVDADPLAPGTVYVRGSPSDVGEDFALRSDDRGAAWTHLPRTGSFLTPDPVVKARVWLGSDGHTLLSRSDDRGATWVEASSGTAGRYSVGLAFDAQDPQAHLLMTDTGVFRTEDGGATWADWSEGLPVGHRRNPPLALVADPSVAGRAYAVYLGGVYRRDAGGAWRPLPAVNVPAYPIFVSALAVDPATPSRIYVGVYGGLGVYVSEDGGSSFEQRAAGLAREDYDPERLQGHPDVREILIDRTNPARVIAALSTEPYISDDHGHTWRPLGRAGLPDVSAGY